MVVHICNQSIWEARQEDCCKLEASVNYRMSLRTTWTTRLGPYLKTTQVKRTFSVCHAFHHGGKTDLIVYACNVSTGETEARGQPLIKEQPGC